MKSNDFMFMRQYGTPAFGVNPADHIEKVIARERMKDKIETTKSDKLEQHTMSESHQHIQCPICHREYSTREEYKRHMRVCEIADKSQSSKSSERRQAERKASELPDYEELVKTVETLKKLVNKQQTQIEILNRYMKKENKKISICEWLKRETQPSETFTQLVERIVVNDDDILFLYDNHYFDTIANLFSRHIIHTPRETWPMRAIQQRRGYIYIYDSLDNLKQLKISIKTEKESNIVQWLCIPSHSFKSVINKIMSNVYKCLLNWMKNRSNDASQSIKMMNAIRKTSTMSDEPEVRAIRIINKIFNKIKDEQQLTMVVAV